MCECACMFVCHDIIMVLLATHVGVLDLFGSL